MEISLHMRRHIFLFMDGAVAVPVRCGLHFWVLFDTMHSSVREKFMTSLLR